MNFKTKKLKQVHEKTKEPLFRLELHDVSLDEQEVDPEGRRRSSLLSPDLGLQAARFYHDDSDGSDSEDMEEARAPGENGVVEAAAGEPRSLQNVEPSLEFEELIFSESFQPTTLRAEPTTPRAEQRRGSRSGLPRMQESDYIKHVIWSFNKRVLYEACEFWQRQLMQLKLGSLASVSEKHPVATQGAILIVTSKLSDAMDAIATLRQTPIGPRYSRQLGTLKGRVLSIQLTVEADSRELLAEAAPCEDQVDARGSLAEDLAKLLAKIDYCITKVRALKEEEILDPRASLRDVQSPVGGLSSPTKQPLAGLWSPIPQRGSPSLQDPSGEAGKPTTGTRRFSSASK